MTGQAKYTGDIELPGMLVGARAAQPACARAHCQRRRQQGRGAPRREGPHHLPGRAESGPLGSSSAVLDERVRFAGEAVAAVAAVDVETADAALRLIQVQYDVLPFVLDPEEALEPGAPKLFEDGNQEGPSRVLTRGDIATGLAESDRVIERESRCPTMWSGGMEPRCAIAMWEQNRLTLRASTQAPYRVHIGMRRLQPARQRRARNRHLSAAASAPRARRTPMKRSWRYWRARRGGQ